MLQKLRRNQGRMFTAIGVAHVVVIGYQYRAEWRELFADGFVGQISEQGKPYQAQGYWSMILAPMLIATGQIAQAHIDRTGGTPRAFNLTLAGASIIAGVAMPVNGIWTVAATALVGLTGEPDTGLFRRLLR